MKTETDIFIKFDYFTKKNKEKIKSLMVKSNVRLAGWKIVRENETNHFLQLIFYFNDELVHHSTRILNSLPKEKDYIELLEKVQDY